jgi:regulator of CtrA degradation
MKDHAQFAKFIDRTFDETFQLLQEAKEYSTFNWKEDLRGRPKVETLRVNNERMRLTARLSEIMAWLLIHKAVANGEVAPERAQSEPFHLSSQEVCMTDDRTDDVDWPTRLNEMVDRSLDLYGRVSKMDEMASRLFVRSQ